MAEQEDDRGDRGPFQFSGINYSGFPILLRLRFTTVSVAIIFFFYIHSNGNGRFRPPLAKFHTADGWTQQRDYTDTTHRNKQKQHQQQQQRLSKGTRQRRRYPCTKEHDFHPIAFNCGTIKSTIMDFLHFTTTAIHKEASIHNTAPLPLYEDYLDRIIRTRDVK